MIDCELLRNCALLRIKIRAWANSRAVKLPDSAVQGLLGMSDEETATPDGKQRIKEARARFKGGKKLIDCQQYDVIRSFLADEKAAVINGFANPSGIDDGLFAVKLASADRVKEQLAKADGVLKAILIPAFRGMLAAKIEESRRVLGPQFNAKDYPDPDKLDQYFGIDYRFISLSVPEGLSPALREAEEKKLRDTYEEAKNNIIRALWEEMSGLLGHISERLETGPGGDRKKFNSTLLEGLDGFVKAFENKNAFNDERLSKLVSDARNVLSTAVDGSPDLQKAAERLRDYTKVREQVGSAFTVLKAEVDKGIESLPERKFDFTEK